MRKHKPVTMMSIRRGTFYCHMWAMGFMGAFTTGLLAKFFTLTWLFVWALAGWWVFLTLYGWWLHKRK